MNDSFNFGSGLPQNEANNTNTQDKQTAEQAGQQFAAAQAFAATQTELGAAPGQAAAGGAPSIPVPDAASAAQVMRQIMAKVFVYMFSGLALTALIALIGASSPDFTYFVYENYGMYQIVFLVQLAVVIGFSLAARKAKAGLSRALFFIYSILTGFTLAFFLTLFDVGSIAMTFGVTALTFGGMALWGYKTKRDLRPIGVAGRMLLIGAIIASLLNMLLYLVAPGTATLFDMLMNYVVLAIFIGLTAYDFQKIRLMAQEAGVYYSGQENAQLRESIAINGALMLYLDFINIFIRLLAIMGKRRR